MDIKLQNILNEVVSEVLNEGDYSVDQFGVDGANQLAARDEAIKQASEAVKAASEQAVADQANQAAVVGDVNAVDPGMSRGPVLDTLGAAVDKVKDLGAQGYELVRDNPKTALGLTGAALAAGAGALALRKQRRAAQAAAMRPAMA